MLYLKQRYRQMTPAFFYPQEKHDIIPVRSKGKLTDIRIDHVEKISSMVAATPEGMGKGSAYNIFELFNYN